MDNVLMEPQSGRGQAKAVFAFAFCLLPVVVFYVLLLRAMRPVPMYDDYHAILGFVLRMKELPSLGARMLYLVAAQHDEYKLIVEHTVVAADWALTHRVHFGFLILLGNSLVLGVGYALWQNTVLPSEDVARRLGLFAPVCYLLFQLNYVENLDWAMCGLQTMPVLLCALASLHFLLRRGRGAVVLACLFAIGACLSSANGFLLAPIGVLLLLSKGRIRATALWTLAIGLAVVLYRYNYVPFRAAGDAPTGTSALKALFFLSFLGGAVENIHHLPLRHGSIALGVVILLVFGQACRTRVYRTEPFPFWMAVWCLLSAAVVAQFRAGQGLTISLTGRYKVYSDLLLIACYIFGVRWFHASRLPVRRKVLVYSGAFGAAILFAGAGDFFGEQFLVRRERRVMEGLREYRADPARNPPEISINGEPFAGDEPAYARLILTQAIEQGIYRLPPVPSR